MQMFEERANLAALRKWRLRLLGTGNGTAPSVDMGHGVTVTWIATGRNTLTFAENPGTFVGIGSAAFRDTTQSNVKGMTLTAGLYPATASTFTLEIDFWGSDAAAAADLATSSYCDLELIFSELKSP